ncbi:DUF2182 domain-containing protein [Pseudomaricurvus sp. HS19]|uniref:DUF2182 domain-containing protein n=1 Tax=Pseudomaricurvus sp. HS19 TaxID=2692626 RepID=UPI00136C2339|nr:DUF2182 domain-containing protein [Pseudomaricurvus sp. HS19]MYM64080.1 DUF2182 domain-containing protein [Pseudomaricurvus sp. HS19]
MTPEGNRLPPSPVSLPEAWAGREPWITSALLCLTAVASWTWLLQGAGTGMDSWAMSVWRLPTGNGEQAGGGGWSLHYSLIMLAMWWVMMIAMMLPSASPMILLYARVYRFNYPTHTDSTASDQSAPATAISLFTLGYLLMWLLFSIAAASAHGLLEWAAIVHPMMMWINVPQLSALLLLIAGVYQLTPLKESCLRHCQQPAQYLTSHWRRGRWGPLRMGLDHGLYCLGCCWALMLLLFVGGAMNLIWIVGLSVWVLLEKFSPRWPWVQRLSALALIIGGILLWYQAAVIG